MFRSTYQRSWVLFAVVFLSAAISKAAVVYTTESAFTAALSLGNYFQNFSGFAAGDQNSTTTGDLSGGTAFHFTITTPAGALANTLYVITPIGNYPGGRAMSTRVDANDLTLTFTSGNVTAVGANFSLTDLSENRYTGASGTFDITLSDGTVLSDIGSPTSGALPFRGFTTSAGNPITSLTFHPDSGFATLDNLYVGAVSAVPEPAATGIAAGLLCLLVAGRGVLMRVCSKLRSRAA